MNQNKIDKLKMELEFLRQRKRNLTNREIVSFANKCGRQRIDRGNEPTYINIYLPYQKPLSIPSHPGNMRAKTVANILDILEADLFELEFGPESL
jgi:hypothetical protein